MATNLKVLEAKKKKTGGSFQAIQKKILNQLMAYQSATFLPTIVGSTKAY